MKKITRYYRSFFSLLLIVLLLAFLAGCDDFTPTTYGSIDIKSTPAGAKVYLDGEDTDSITPIVLTEISPGTHTVKLELYHYKIKEDTNVLVTAGGTTYRNWALTYAPAEAITLQPGSDGKDAYVVSSSMFIDTNFNEDYTWVGNWGSERERTYLQFDLSAVPADAVVEDTILKLYQFDIIGSGDFSVGLYPVTSSWEEDEVTWSNQPGSSPEAEDTCTVSSTISIWRDWDIDDLVRGWLEGSIPNYGMLLKATNEASINIKAGFRTSDFSVDASKRPQLEIDYYIP